MQIVSAQVPKRPGQTEAQITNEPSPNNKGL